MPRDDSEIETAESASDTLSADMANTVLGWIKAQTKPWGLMSYEEQAELVAGATVLACDTVRKAVQAIAADGRRTILATVEKVAFVKQGVQATLLASTFSEYRHALSDSRGLQVMLVVADASEYIGGEIMQPDAPKNDQPALDLGEDRPVFDNTPNGRD